MCVPPVPFINNDGIPIGVFKYPVLYVVIVLSLFKIPTARPPPRPFGTLWDRGQFYFFLLVDFFGILEDLRDLEYLREVRVG